MKHANYNVDAAIYMRSTNSTVLEDSYGNTQPVDFKLSIELAKDEMFMFGWGYEMLQQMGFGDRRDITKEEYKRISTNFRKYYYDLSKDPDYINAVEDTCPNA